MTRSELDWAEVPYPDTIAGTAQTLPSEAEEHGAHAFLYVPDITMGTGWSTHRVPEREPERQEARGVGFRWRR